MRKIWVAGAVLAVVSLLVLQAAPPAPDLAKLKKGHDLYEQHCALCHGPKGDADTPVGKPMKARNLLADPFKQGESEADIAKTLEAGVPGTGMVAFTAQLPAPEDRQAVAAYVAYLRQHKQAPEFAEAPVAAAPAAKADPAMAKLRKGRDFYEQQCSLCHGAKGDADSPTGKALKARNFVADPFKQGESEADIAKTLETGVPGTGMVAFTAASQLPTPEDRQAVAAYVAYIRQHKKPPVIEDDSGAEPEVEAEVTISYAMKLLTREPREAIIKDFPKQGPGYEVYARNCASCHGANGEGGIAVKIMASAPYERLKTNAIFGHNGPWLKDMDTFTLLVTKGLPGGTMPGAGTLTKKEVAALYQYMKGLVE